MNEKSDSASRHLSIVSLAGLVRAEIWISAGGVQPRALHPSQPARPLGPHRG